MAKTSGDREGRRAAAKSAREERWRKEVDAWSRSGLNKVDFCRQRSLSTAAFYWWVRELAARDGVGKPRRRSQRKGRTTRVRRSRQEILALIAEYQDSGLTQRAFSESKGIDRSLFGNWLRAERRKRSKGSGGALVAVRLQGEPVAKEIGGQRPGVELTLLSGHTLRVFEGFDAETLTRLLRVIDQQC